MIQEGIRVLYLFLIYSFLGWVLETSVSLITQRKLSNRGLNGGPVCILYGFTAVIMFIGLHELSGVWLVLGAMIYGTVLEWISGRLIERCFRVRLWDYSHIRWNLDGYICLPVSVCWGVLGAVSVHWLTPLFLRFYDWLPARLVEILVCSLLLLVVIDTLLSCMILRSQRGSSNFLTETNNRFVRISRHLRDWIQVHMIHRIERAYPHLTKREQDEDEQVFASGCSFYKVAMLFFIGAFLGDITEMVFCRLKAGVWMSRSSVVWGPFSIVWGLALSIATVLLYKYRNKSDAFLFWMGTLLGGAYEYFCSVFTEIVFGKVFWDYSHMPFNLGGRINLLYCFFWGIAAVVWVKKLYPRLSGWIEKIPVRCGKVITWLLILFMCCNVFVSCLALMRYDERGRGVAAEKSWQMLMDKHYDDETMKRIYPNATTMP